MKLVKPILEKVVEVFFKIFFLIFGEPKISDNLGKAIDLYKHRGFSSLFAKIRAWDAPYDQVEKLIPSSAKVLDLGSGDGLMANFLALSSRKRKVSGIELNKMRVKESYRGLKNTSFSRGNIVKSSYKEVDVVLLIHVLHHLSSFDAQEEVIKKISKTLSKNKKLIILEIDDKPFLKYIFSFLVDAIVVPILFERKLFSFDFRYRKKKEWLRLLKEYGFSIVAAKHVSKGMPFSHILINTRKK